MAYSAPTSDFVASALNGAIAAGDATINIGTGLDLPATNGILQIDYDSEVAVGSDNGPETIAYATYNSGTGALGGCTRGLNGTTGVAHANAANVISGPSASYWGTGSIITADIGDGQITHGKISTAAGEGALTSKIITATRDCTAASGDVAYSGVGFIPSSIHALAVVDGTAFQSDGWSDSAKANQCVYQATANTFYNAANLVAYSNYGTWANSAVLKSYDADGFTLTWTKIASPTAGTLKMVFICYR